jgi:hypothetical protein
MGRGKQAAERPAQVEELAERIEHWRTTRSKRGPMPQELWLTAVDLAKTHGVGAIARWLKLDYYSLKRRVGGGPPRQAAEPKDAETAFVELKVADETVDDVRTIEFIDADGAMMTVRGYSSSDLDLPALAGAFLARRQ